MSTTDNAPAVDANNTTDANNQDLTVFVQNLLQQMQTRFQTMSNAIIGRIDDMGGKIDELEKSIGELMTQAGIDDDVNKQQAANTATTA